MGIAAWMVWHGKKVQGARGALLFYLIQLALNALWSWFFFSCHFGALAFANIMVLWLLIAITLHAS